MSVSPLPAESLMPKLGSEELPFRTTAELEHWHGFLGHRRATEAIEFAIAMPGTGYNLFALGEPGTGRLTLVSQLFDRAARQQQTPPDWLYLNRFDEAREPVPLCLPAGEGQSLVVEIESLIDRLLVSVWSAFENPSYQRRKANLERAFKERYDAALDRIAERADEVGVVMFRNGETVSFSPLKDGRPVDEAGFGELDDDEREQFHQQVRMLEDCLNEGLLGLPQWKRETGDQLRLLAGELVEQAVAPPLGSAAEKYAHCSGVLDYLEKLRADFSQAVVPEILEQRGHDSASERDRRDYFRHRYTPRLLVSRIPEHGAPVLFEPDPSLPNLFGRIEYVSEQGALTTDHHLIFPGALHRANGGYLILEAEKVIAEPPVWSALTRSLKSGSVRFEAPTPEQGTPTIATLNPAAIPLSVKVALVGSQDLYYALRELDPEFPDLFRALAEFDLYFARDARSMMDFSGLLKTLAEVQGLPPLSAGAVACLLSQSARLAEHQDRLSARVGRIMEVASEADLYRQRFGGEIIEACHVQQAMDAKSQRLGRIQQELLGEILDGVVLIATDGFAIGSVNALTLLEIGDMRIGSPARITATVYIGSRGVVDIEREAELGQAIHSKGVMILAGYLGQQFARRFPLAISANIALEQSYGYVDGDSAALAEVCALLSALTGVPIDQGFAVTGSLNQYGEVQAVGGVNEKIEGFFAVCRARTMTGRQGVVIPRANLRNLVLGHDVVRAAREGLFEIYAAATLDEVLEILTRRPAEAIKELALTELEKFARYSLRTGRSHRF